MLRNLLLATTLLAAAAAPAFAEDSYNWTGFHLGINAGYGGGNFHYPMTGNFTDSTGSYTLNGRIDLGSNGALGGGQVGYDWLCPEGWLVGLETDIAGSDISRRLHAAIDVTGSGHADLDAAAKLEYLGTVRARAGRLVDDAVLVYATVGFAYGSVRSDANLNFTDTASHMLLVNVTESRIDPGWTAGAGTEYAFNDRLSLRAEYLYVDLGSHTIAEGPFSAGTGTGSGSIKAGTTAHIGRIGLNYKLN